MHISLPTRPTQGPIRSGELGAGSGEPGAGSEEPGVRSEEPEFLLPAPCSVLPAPAPPPLGGPTIGSDAGLIFRSRSREAAESVSAATSSTTPTRLRI